MYIKVVAYTNCKKEKLVKKKEDTFEIYVKEKPERNKANKRIIEILSVFLGKNTRKIRIVNGHYHPHKLLVIEE